MRIVAGPFVLQKHNKERLSFEFENMRTGEVLPLMHDPHCFRRTECNWMPVVGSDRKALMVDVNIQFEPVGDVLVEADGDVDCA